MVGMVSLGLLKRSKLVNSHWNFCNLEYEPEKLTFSSVVKAVKALWKIRNEHRNYVWKQGIEEAYSLAFYLPPQYQYYVNKYKGYKPTIFQTLAFYINILTTYFGKNKSTKMILWLMLEDLKHPLRRLIPRNKWLLAYFGSDHPFCSVAKSEDK